MRDQPRQLRPNDPGIPKVLDLLIEAFAYMDGRIDPPSSLSRMSVDDLDALATKGHLWVIGHPPVATVTLTPMGDCLYLGKLAVSSHARNAGHARRLVELAKNVAGNSELPCLRLETRVELVENRKTFERLGFVKTGETAHAGYDRPTSITMELPLSPA